MSLPKGMPTQPKKSRNIVSIIVIVIVLVLVVAALTQLKLGDEVDAVNEKQHQLCTNSAAAIKQFTKSYQTTNSEIVKAELYDKLEKMYAYHEKNCR